MNFQSPRRFLDILLLPVFCLLMFAGCSSSYNHVVSIAVTPVGPSIGAGKTQQFMATATYNNNKTADLTSQVTWASDAMGVATITSAGLATGVSAGTANITATLGTVVSPKDLLTVTSAATLVSIAITPNPPPATVAVAGTLQLTATGTYSDTSTKDLTTQVTWNSVTTSVATISASGLVTGVAVGTSNITATLGAVVSPIDVITVTTTSVTLSSITVNPASATIPVGGTADFTATGHYSDGSTQVLAAATWSSLTPATANIVATPAFTSTAVPPVTTSVGVAQGLAASATAVTIKATSGAISGNASLTVSAALVRDAYVTGTTDSKNAVYVVNPISTMLLPIQSGLGNGIPSQIIPEPSGRFAFGLNTSSVSTASIDPVTGRLVPPFLQLNTGVNARFGVVDPTGQYLYVASYTSTTTSLTPYLINLVDGSLTPIGSPISFVGLVAVITDRSGKYLYAVDSDPTVQKVFAYSIGAGGALTAIGAGTATGGAPQYPAIDPSNTYLYVPNQNDGTISAYTINADGSLTALVGSPFSTGVGVGPSDVAVEATGKFLYVTNNVDSTISALSIGTGGALGAPAAGSPFSTGAAGTTPFGIAIDPSNTMLLVSNLFGNSISMFNLNAATGLLTAPALPQIESPTGIYFINLSTGVATHSVSPGAVYAANSVSGDISAFTSTLGTGVLSAAAGSPFTGVTGNSFAASDLQGNFLFTLFPGKLLPLTGAQAAGFSVTQSSGGITALGGSPFLINGTDQASSVYVSPTDAFAYALDTTSGSVVQYTLTSTTVASPAPTVAFAGANNLAADPQGAFLFALGNSLTNGIQPYLTYLSGGALTSAAQLPAIPGNWSSGAVDATGLYLVAADSTAKTLQSFTISIPGSGTDGVLAANGGTQAVTGTGPVFVVAFDPLDRVVFVGDQGAGTITVYPFNVSTGLLSAAGTVTPVSANGITQIVVDTTGNYLYVGVNAATVPGSKGAIAVYKIGAAGALTAVATSPFTTGTGNPGIAVTDVVQ